MKQWWQPLVVAKCPHLCQEDAKRGNLLALNACGAVYFVYLGIGAFVAAYLQVALWTLTGALF